MSSHHSTSGFGAKHVLLISLVTLLLTWTLYHGKPSPSPSPSHGEGISVEDTKGSVPVGRKVIPEPTDPTSEDVPESRANNTPISDEVEQEIRNSPDSQSDADSDTTQTTNEENRGEIPEKPADDDKEGEAQESQNQRASLYRELQSKKGTQTKMFKPSFLWAERIQDRMAVEQHIQSYLKSKCSKKEEGRIRHHGDP